MWKRHRRFHVCEEAPGFRSAPRLNMEDDVAGVICQALPRSRQGRAGSGWCTQTGRRGPGDAPWVKRRKLKLKAKLVISSGGRGSCFAQTARSTHTKLSPKTRQNPHRSTRPTHRIITKNPTEIDTDPPVPLTQISLDSHLKTRQISPESVGR